MYEDQTYENILDRSLARVASDVDKREGSVIMNAIAPVSAEHADVYIQLGNIVNNGYADTAVREFLILRCKERGIIPYEATKATLKGKFNMEIPIGSRFNLNELNYVATAFMESADGYFYYQMECETEGTNGNKFFGELSSIEYIDKDLTGELTELLIPAEDEEDTEALRTRYLNSFDSNPFGGNKQDYVEKTDALDGVGGTVVIPVWNGGGTVKLIIINSDFGVASSTLVKAVQEAIDPDPQGTGSGIAPIGHTVTVVSAVGKTVSIKSRITLNDTTTGYKSLGYHWSHSNGYQSAFGIDPEHPELLIPTEASGSDVFTGNYVWQNYTYNSEMIGAIKELATEVKYMRGDLNETVERLNKLEGKDGDKWDKFKWLIVTGLVTLILGYLAVSVGLK